MPTAPDLPPSYAIGDFAAVVEAYVSGNPERIALAVEAVRGSDDLATLVPAALFYTQTAWALHQRWLGVETPLPPDLVGRIVAAHWGRSTAVLRQDLVTVAASALGDRGVLPEVEPEDTVTLCAMIVAWYAEVSGRRPGLIEEHVRQVLADGPPPGPLSALP